MTKENFLANPKVDVFSFGRPPVSIDILTQVKGLNFNESFQGAVIFDVDDLNVRLINYHDLLKAKTAANRPKDLDDLQNL